MSVGTAIGFCENSIKITVVKLPALLVREDFFDLLMHRGFALLEDIARNKTRASRLQHTNLDGEVE